MWIKINKPSADTPVVHFVIAIRCYLFYLFVCLILRMYQRGQSALVLGPHTYIRSLILRLHAWVADCLMLLHEETKI